MHIPKFINMAWGKGRLSSEGGGAQAFPTESTLFLDRDVAKDINNPSFN